MGLASASRDPRLMRIIALRRDVTPRSTRALLARVVAMLRPALPGYAAAVGGIALISTVIALVQTHAHIENISLLYLLVVLWLATVFGRGPAIFASALAFLTYDFLFIPPYYRLTVDAPSEWISLFALLATSLVLGQLTAANQARTREAVASQREAVARRQEAVATEQRTAALYALAQLIVSSSDRQRLWQLLADEFRRVFAPAGVTAVALILPDTWSRPTVAAFAADGGTPSGAALMSALSLQTAEHTAHARSVLQQGKTAGELIHLPDGEPQAVYFLPLHANQQCIGVLGIGGAVAPVRQVVTELVRARGAPAGAAHPQTIGDGQGALLAAMCDTVALAIERDALRATAVHAEALQESDRLKDVLLGSVTHDLRTPLAAIQAAADSLLEPDLQWSDEERAEFVRTIATSARRLSRLVSNLLDLSRLEAGVAVPQKDWHDLEDIVATVLDRLDVAGRVGGRRILITAPEDLPLVHVDHIQLEQVLTNLLENALKYSPDTAPISVRVSAHEQPREVHVAVRDEGIGIPPSELSRIFDKFYRIQHATLPWLTARPPVGTGLGLAICKGIIEAHGGRIWAESTPGNGTTVIFTLPLPAEARAVGLPDLPAERATHEGKGSDCAMNHDGRAAAARPRADSEEQAR